MSTELATVNNESLGIVLQTETIDDVSGQKFLPRIQLIQGTSEIAKKGEASAGDLLLIDNKTPTNLGKSFDAFLFQWRKKAMHLVGTSVVEDVYDPNHPSFKAIKNMFDSKSKVDGETYMCGVEFLMYVPKAAKFATFYFGNPTLKNEIPNVYNLWKDAIDNNKGAAEVKFKSTFIKTAKFSWSGCTAEKCEVPIGDYPQDIARREIGNFQRPISKVKERAPEAQTQSESTRDR